MSAYESITDSIQTSRYVRKVPFPEVEYLGRPMSSTDIAIRAHLSLGRLTALVVGNRLSIIITALTQHRLGHSPSPLQPAHRDPRAPDPSHQDRYSTLLPHKLASGSVKPNNLRFS